MVNSANSCHFFPEIRPYSNQIHDQLDRSTESLYPPGYAIQYAFVDPCETMKVLIYCFK